MVASLAARGLVAVEEREVTLDPYASDGALPEVASEGAPTAEQGAAIEAVRAALDGPGRAEPFLLQGVTGSGKTRIYVEVVAEAGRTYWIRAELSKAEEVPVE